jgi:hypothetical protein
MADLSTQMPRAGADYAKNFVQLQNCFSKNESCLSS